MQWNFFKHPMDIIKHFLKQRYPTYMLMGAMCSCAQLHTMFGIFSSSNTYAYTLVSTEQIPAKKFKLMTWFLWASPRWTTPAQSLRWRAWLCERLLVKERYIAAPRRTGAPHASGSRSGWVGSWPIRYLLLFFLLSPIHKKPSTYGSEGVCFSLAGWTTIS